MGSSYNGHQVQPLGSLDSRNYDLQGILMVYVFLLAPTDLRPALFVTTWAVQGAMAQIPCNNPDKTQVGHSANAGSVCAAFGRLIPLWATGLSRYNRDPI